MSQVSDETNEESSETHEEDDCKFFKLIEIDFNEEEPMATTI